MALRQLFYVEGEVLEKVESFRYLGRILAQDDDDIRAVRSQIKKARGIWARVGQVLQADNTPPKGLRKAWKPKIAFGLTEVATEKPIAYNECVVGFAIIVDKGNNTKLAFDKKLMEALDYVREHIEDLLVITRGTL